MTDEPQTVIQTPSNTNRFQQQIGQRIRILREGRQVSRRQLADCLDTPMDEAWIAEVETGQCSMTIEQLDQVAAYLYVPIYAFIDGAIDEWFADREFFRIYSQLPPPTQSIVRRLVVHLHDCVSI